MPSRLNFVISLLHAVVVTNVVTAQTQASTYINAGGPEYVDTNGNTWMTDTYYNTGKTYAVSNPIANTTDEALYQDERWDATAQPDLLYDIPIDNGDYDVVLHFAEVYLDAAGKRVFNVTAEGQVVIDSLDIFERVGADTALKIQVPVTVSDGSLSIEFKKGTQSPKVNAIEVHPVGGTPTSSPSAAPSDEVVTVGTAAPTFSRMPSMFPTRVASMFPSLQPSNAPSQVPSQVPSNPSSYLRSSVPTVTASESPSFLASSETFLNTPAFESIYINAGGTSNFTDSEGRIWSKDEYFSDGRTFTARDTTISGTQDDDLFVSERYSTGGVLTYDIPISYVGDYDVTLLFAENYVTSTGQRVFSISIEGTTVASDFDIFAISGGFNTAFNMTERVSVSDGTLSIAFTPGLVQNPKISAIMVEAVSSPPASSTSTTTVAPDTTTSITTEAIDTTSTNVAPPEFELRINCAGPEYVDSNNNVWIADTYFNTGNSYSVSNEILNTEEDALYQKERWCPPSGGDLTYTIHNIPNGDYEVTLHWAEVYATSAEQRMFDVAVQEEMAFENLDIFASAGFGTALSLSTTAIVADEGLSISFLRKVENPKINAIEIRSLTPTEQPQSTDADSTTTTTVSPMSTEVVTTTSDVEPTTAQAVSSTTEAIGTTTLSVPSSSNTPAFESIYINAGGTSNFTDSEGRIWSKDEYFSDGRTFTARDTTISGTQDDDLFVSERYSTGGVLTYDIPISYVGDYDVTLLFAENYVTSTGQRVFSISIEGTTVASDFDIFAISGGFNTAFNMTERVSVSDGTLSIAFTPGLVQNPKISAIMVEAVSSPPASSTSTTTVAPDTTTTTVAPDTTPSEAIDTTSISVAPPQFELRINCAGSEYVDSDNNVWAADAYFNTGNSYSVSKEISNTEEDALYQKERWCPPSGGTLTYTIPNIPNGDYEVTLHWAEVYASSIGQRVFDVAVQEEMAFENLDIFASAGFDAALSLSTVANVADEELSISFLRKVENPKINAIEIRSLTPMTITSTVAPDSTATFEVGTSTLAVDSTSATTTETTTSVEQVISSTTEAIDTTILQGPVPSTAPVTFEPIYINAGSDTSILDSNTGITWEADNFFNTGKTSTTKEPNQEISNTDFDELYRTERWDEDSFPNLQYDIPLDDGRFRVVLHFAEIWRGTQSANARVFNVYIEDVLELENLDMYDRVGKYAALTEEFILDISDGHLSIMLEHVIENPKISGIEVHSVGVVKPHYAHAVPGGPYVGTDINDTGNAMIAVNGFFSHTHAPGATLESWTWMVNDVVVATGEQAEINFDVGDHILVLEVEDSVGDVSADFTTVSVRPYGYPYIESLTPDAGEMIGGDKVTIYGSGFNLSPSETFVTFGAEVLSGPSEIIIVDDNAIEVLANPQRSWGKVEVTVTTPLDTSNAVIFEYLPEIPLTFTTGNIATGLYGPTVSAIGNDGNLYIGTQGGELMKYSLDDNHNVIGEGPIVANVTLSETYLSRTILGITFDPMDTSPFPAVYISHSTLYHGELPTSFNGVVSVVTGENLDTIDHVITGLPISDHDHGVNGMTFDDNGNLYIQVGGNTNAGAPGALSTSQTQEEDLFSAATLIARNIANSTFDGHVTYNTNGDQIGGWDVGVFASGQRNPYDIVFHSNGKMYGTDNGANYNFGKVSVGCGAGEEYEDDDPFEPDKLNLLEEGHYYGHANRKRGETDPRQCEWRSAFQASVNYTMPIKKLDSSANGICEFESNHFGGAIRGDLIIGRYKGALHHVKLTNEGQKAAGALQDEPPVLINQGGLSVSQGPDGSLFVVSNFVGNVFYHAPDEEEADIMTVKSIFPRRGPSEGGNILKIFGQKMFNATAGPLVTVGGLDCPVVDTKIYTDAASREMQWVKCALPTGVGKSDVVVSFGEEVSAFSSYRYISGK